MKIHPLDPLLLPLSWLLSLLLPKDPRLLVFGGTHFGGNTHALLQRCAEHGFRGVWLSRRRDVLALDDPRIVSARSFRGVWLGARASAAMMTHSWTHFRPVVFPSKRTLIYNLWHGVPIKRVSTADPAFHTRSYARQNLREHRRYRAMFVTSEAMQHHFAKTFGLPPKDVRITGQPRTDVIFDEPPDFDASFDPPLPAHHRRILYAPTWRAGQPVRLFPFDDLERGDLEPLQDFLERAGAVMYVRTHVNDPGGLSTRDRRIVPLQSNVLFEVTDALGAFDALVTDFSGVYFDFLLFERPTIFLPYDLETYSRSPGFYLPYDDIAVGPRPTTMQGFIEALDEALSNPERYAVERRAARELIHRYVDADSSDRVLATISADLEAD